MYIKWQCAKCKEILVSNSKRHHQMDNCKCGETGVDLEEDYSRWIGHPVEIERYDYNFFDEIVLCMREQGFLEMEEYFDIIGHSPSNKIIITLQEVIEIRQLEDEILESLK